MGLLILATAFLERLHGSMLKQFLYFSLYLAIVSLGVDLLTIGLTAVSREVCRVVRHEF